MCGQPARQSECAPHRLLCACLLARWWRVAFLVDNRLGWHWYDVAAAKLLSDGDVLLEGDLREHEDRSVCGAPDFGSRRLRWRLCRRPVCLVESAGRVIVIVVVVTIVLVRTDRHDVVVIRDDKAASRARLVAAAAYGHRDVDWASACMADGSE